MEKAVKNWFGPNSRKVKNLFKIYDQEEFGEKLYHLHEMMKMEIAVIEKFGHNSSEVKNLFKIDDQEKFENELYRLYHNETKKNVTYMNSGMLQFGNNPSNRKPAHQPDKTPYASIKFGVTGPPITHRKRTPQITGQGPTNNQRRALAAQAWNAEEERLKEEEERLKKQRLEAESEESA